MQPFDPGKPAALTGLLGLADRTGVDIRPTLLRVLTDLYVQKPWHSAEEERQYVELASRLIAAVDEATRVAVAARLAAYPRAPREILQALERFSARGFSMTQSALTPSSDALLRDDLDLFEPLKDANDVMSAPTSIVLPQSYVELRDTFFAADAAERKLILMHLEFAASEDMTPIVRDTRLLQFIEQAALAGRIQELTTLLQQALGLSRQTTQRILNDSLGEPFLVAARALAMPGDMFQRAVMFINQAIGHSVERVYILSDLFGELPQHCALHMLAIWREADRIEARGSFYRPLHWHDEGQAMAARTARLPERRLQPARPAPLPKKA